MPLHTPHTHPGFWRKLFRAYHARTRYQEPHSYQDIRDIKIALFHLRRATGLSIENLAARIGVLPQIVNMLEYRGGVMPQSCCELCGQIAESYRLPQLAAFFQLEAIRSSRKSRKKRTSETDSDGNLRD